MTEAVVPEAAKKTSKLPLILGVLLALLGGGGAFYATYSGLLLGSESSKAKENGGAHAEHSDEDGHAPDAALSGIEPLPLGDAVFIPLDPLVISLPPSSTSRHLKFQAQLEVAADAEAEVRALTPRVIDVLNSYLRAVEAADFADPAVLGRLRAQMLRRVQVVAGANRVRDLLIMEFVLN